MNYVSTRGETRSHQFEEVVLGNPAYNANKKQKGVAKYIRGMNAVFLKAVVMRAYERHALLNEPLVLKGGGPGTEGWLGNGAKKKTAEAAAGAEG